ncbi:MAG: chemotaxis protein [Robiginitomaculum sp.]|nr:MAG: chemotaxis protein [Robiginitomaculum sp.]
MSSLAALKPRESFVPAIREDAIPLLEPELRRIAQMLDADAGIHLSMEKTSLVHSRLIKRLKMLKMDSFKKYCNFVDSPDGKTERREMLMSLTTNLTRFFREAHHFEHLVKEALPPLLERAKKGERIRIWSAGCSNGQEPYSIAAIILSLLPEANNYDIKILASDIDCHMIAHGNRGLYAESIIEKMPAELRTKHFELVDTPDGKMYEASHKMKSLISFRELNLNAPRWPMRGKFQIIFCRNVVIYFNLETQVVLWERFKQQLCGPGYLYIGHSERLTGPAVDLFENVATTTYQLTSLK